MGTESRDGNSKNKPKGNAGRGGVGTNNTVAEIRNAFDGLIRTLKKESEDLNIGLQKFLLLKSKEKKRLKKYHTITMGQYQKV